MRIRSGNQQTEGVDTLEVPAEWTVSQPDRGHVSVALGALLLAKYVLKSDGATVTAYDATGTVVGSGADGAAVLTALLPAASSAGYTIEFRNDGNVFPWSTVPALPKGLTSRLTIRGNGATVQLSASGPRFLDFNKTADHDTFQNIEITDFVIDVNNIGGQHHVVLGTYAAGAITTRINIQDIAIRRVRTINVPVDPTATNHRLNVYFNVKQALASEGTQNVIRRVVVEDCKFFGGNMGVAAVATVTSGTTRALNVLVEDIHFSRCHHSMLALPGGAGNVGAHYFIGSGAKGGTAMSTISECYGEFSSDVGVEVDSVNATVERCTMVDVRNASFFHTTFNDALNGAGTNEVTFRSCTSVCVTANTAIAYSVRGSGGANSSRLGKVTVDDCKAYTVALGNVMPATGWALLRDDVNTPAGTYTTTLAVNKLRCYLTGVAYNSASAQTMAAVEYHPLAGGQNEVFIDDVLVTMTGSFSGAPTLTFNAVRAYGTGIQGRIENVRWDCTGVTGLSSNALRLVEFGLSGATTLSGDMLITRCRFVNVGDQTGSFAAAINISSANLTMGATQWVRVLRNDTSKGTGSTIAILAANKNRIMQGENTLPVQPVPTTLAGLVTATGAALATGWARTLVNFGQGTGTAITAIDVSTNGGTNYTNLLTQASGALPAGFDQSFGPFAPDALVKVTFTGTQPTINLIPVDP